MDAEDGRKWRQKTEGDESRRRKEMKAEDGRRRKQKTEAEGEDVG